MNRKPFIIKLAILAAVTVLLCIVLARIGELVDERQARQQEAAAGIEDALAGAQTLIGPLLTRHCRESWVTGRGDAESRDFTLTAAPARLQVHGSLTPETRHRGLFKVNAYAAALRAEAHWADLQALKPLAERTGAQVDCGEVLVMAAVSDARGLRSAEIQRTGHRLPVKPGTAHAAFQNGLHAVLPAQPLDQGLVLQLAMDLVGSRSFGLVPAAGSTAMALQSNWRHPSFTGRFLPTERQVGESGFAAQWRVSELASSAAAQVAAGASEKQLDALVVELIDPVNPYVMADRAIKYGLMFIALTFVTVGLTELLAGRRVHPAQYLLVGLALCLFFLLLLSLSEHLPFIVSYAAAAGAVVAVLTPYAAAMLGGWRRGLAFGGGIALLYGALYVLLSREQTALVIGAVLLFGVLAAVMMLTRRLDWYRLGVESRDQAG